ncbi:hypothetical protein S83_063644, partial [Arachis hypogaea]
MLSETPLGVEFRRSFSQAPFEYTRSFRRRNSARAHMLAVHTRAGARAGLVYASPGNPRGSVAVVARKATLPLTIPRRVFKSSAKDSTRRAFGIALHGVPQGSSALGVSPTARASGGPGPLLLVGKRAAGARVASSPDSDLEAFSHNPTHGRADIEGSKSNVAMNAWLPQASYPCGNFSDTSSFKFRRSKGSLGHAFTVRIHVPPQPNSPPDNVFRPDRPAEASLGSKKRGNAPPPIHGIIGLESSSTGSSFPADSAKPVPLAVVSLDSRQGQWESLGFPLSVPVLSRLFDARGRGPEGPIPNPSPDRHATTRSRHESSSSSPPTADGFGAGTPVPSPQSQSFSRGYGSILPTSLAYIVPSTRGCSPWRPDAVMSTTGRDRHSVLRIFKGRRGRTGHHATCGALPAAGPYLRLSRFQGGQAICTDGRSARARAPGFAATAAPSYSSRHSPCPDGRYRCGPPPEFPLASPRSGIVHHLSGPDRHALTRTLHRRSGSVGGATPGGIPPISFLAPCGFIHPLTRTHVRLLGPCFKTGRMGSPQADARSAQVPKHASGRALPSTIATMTYPRAYRRPGLGPPSQSASVDAPSRLADQRRRSTSDRGASPAPIRFPPDNFKHSLTLFSKSFSSFPRGTCSLSVSRQYLALDGIYRPIRAAFPNNPTRRQRLVVRQGPGTTGLSPSLAPPSRGLGPGPPLRTLLQTTIQTPGATDSHAGLFP